MLWAVSAHKFVGSRTPFTHDNSTPYDLKGFDAIDGGKATPERLSPWLRPCDVHGNSMGPRSSGNTTILPAKAGWLRRGSGQSCSRPVVGALPRGNRELSRKSPIVAVSTRLSAKNQPLRASSIRPASRSIAEDDERRQNTIDVAKIAALPDSVSMLATRQGGKRLRVSTASTTSSPFG